MKKEGYKELKILSSLHTWFITNLPNWSSALLTSSPDLCMEVLFELQTGLRCVPLKQDRTATRINCMMSTLQEVKSARKKTDKKSLKSLSSTAIPGIRKRTAWVTRQ